jgi:hypothetical protein
VIQSGHAAAAVAAAATVVGVDSLAAVAAAVVAAVVVDFPVQQVSVQDPGSNWLLAHPPVAVADRKVGSAAQGASRGRQEGQIERPRLPVVAAAAGAEKELRSLGVYHKQRRVEEGDHKMPGEGGERGPNESASHE